MLKNLLLEINRRIILFVWGIVVAVVSFVHPVSGIKVVLKSINFMGREVVDRK